MQYLAVFKNTSYQTFARILTSGSGFLISILIARSFGAATYGDYIKITSFVTLFYLLSDFGINAIFLQRKDSQESFKHLLYLRLTIAAVLFVIANTIALALPYSSNLGTGFSPFVKLGIQIFSLQLFIQSVLFSTSAIFQKKLRYDLWARSLGVGSLVSLLLVSIAVFYNQSLHTVLLALVFSGLVSVGLALLYAKEKILPVSFDIKISKDLVIASIPLGLMLVFNLIYFRIDSLILAVFRSSSDVGIYGLSYLFFDFLLAIPLFISNSIYPILLATKENKMEFLKLVKSYFLIYLGFSFMIAVPFWFSTPLFSAVKPELAGAIIPFRILLLSLPFFFLTSFLQWILITFKKTGFLLGVYFFLMCVNVILNFVFIPQYSYIASAVITGICEIFIFIILSYKLIRLRYEK